MMQQGTQEWLAARLGKATASRVVDATARTKTGYGASRANYRAELVVERMTQVPYPTYSNSTMQYGIDTEPEARSAYTEYAFAAVQEAGFIEHPKIAMAGASPDGFVGDDGLVEIKCPNTATHLETLDSGAIDGKYIKQMQFQMACTGRKWCDFVSYDNRLPQPMRLFVKRVVRDDKLIAEIEQEITLFLAEVEAQTSRLTARYLRKEAA